MTSQENPQFTIFTATYNRKELLFRAYQSVLKQTLKNFEWVIIDDGSSDGTEQMVNEWKKEVDFPLIYVWQTNGGKHTAFNALSKMARGELIVNLDSDDELVPETLARYKFHWDSMSIYQRSQIGCMMCVVKDQNGNIVGEYFPEDRSVEDFWHLYLAKNVRGEKGAALVTSIYKQFLYPDDIRNVYMPEGIFLHKMSVKWKTYCINEALRIYWMDERDDHDGDNMLSPKNYPGNHQYHLAYINYSIRLFWRAPRIFLANSVYYVKLSFHLDKGVGEQCKNLINYGARLLWLVSLPMGYLLYLRDRKKVKEWKYKHSNA